MKKISVREIEKNLISLIAEDGALLTAGNEQDGANTMMVNWGGMGYLWHKNFCFIAVRKSRYTLPFIQKNGSFSLNFFTNEYRDRMTYCGTVSGRDADKFSHCGFEVKYEGNIPYIDKALLVITCKTMYTDDIEPCHFENREIYERWYKGGKHEGDMHEFFIGEVVSAFKPQE